MKKTTAERLHELAEYFKVTQTEICERTGIGCAAMSNYWRGYRLPRQNTLTVIGDAFGVNEAWLMGYDVPMKRPAEGPLPLLLTDDNTVPYSEDIRQLNELIRSHYLNSDYIAQLLEMAKLLDLKYGK